MTSDGAHHKPTRPVRTVRVEPIGRSDGSDRPLACDHDPQFIIGSPYDQCRRCGAYVPTAYGRQDGRLTP